MQRYARLVSERFDGYRLQHSFESECGFDNILWRNARQPADLPVCRMFVRNFSQPETRRHASAAWHPLRRLIMSAVHPQLPVFPSIPCLLLGTRNKVISCASRSVGLCHQAPQFFVVHMILKVN
jgi:hypothetical protein